MKPFGAIVFCRPCRGLDFVRLNPRFHRGLLSAAPPALNRRRSLQLRECGISRSHIFAFANHKLFLAKGKDSNMVKIMGKIAPHLCGLIYC